MTEELPMTPIEYYDSLIETAMKAGDKDMLSLFRLVKSEMTKQLKDKGSLDQQSVYKTMKKHLLEEIEGLEKAGRDTTIQYKHLEWIIDQMPKPVSEEDIRLSIKEYLSDYPDTNIGKIMGHLKLIYHDKTLDMQLASKIAKEMLGN